EYRVAFAMVDLFSTDFYQVFLYGLHSSLGGKVPDPSFGRRGLPHQPEEVTLKNTGLYIWTEVLVFINNPSSRHIYVQTWSRREAKQRGQVIMLHGVSAHGGCLTKLVPGYTAAGLQVHLMDLPGHGRSDGVHADAASMRRLVQALHSVVQYALEQYAGPVFLVGYSLGGLVAINYCLEYPNDVSGLSLVSPCVKLHPAIIRGPSTVALARILAFLAPRLALPSPQRRRIDTTSSTLAYQRSARIGTLMMILRSTAKLPERLYSLQMPFLVQQGAKDSMLDPHGAHYYISLLVPLINSYALLSSRPRHVLVPSNTARFHRLAFLSNRAT
ncbi:hypothetical protein L0F63_005936, partial [Massospora cicadina]